jgi:hypothetical protein
MARLIGLRSAALPVARCDRVADLERSFVLAGAVFRCAEAETRSLGGDVDGLNLAGEVVKVHAPHRGSCELDSQLWDGVPDKPRCKQRADGGAVGV